jgi:glycosyltransferase A (GT-A) superfamily protein (DUF2064 family)
VTGRLAAVWWRGGAGDAEGLDRAMLEDVVDLLAEMPQVDPVLLTDAAGRSVAESVTWPSMRVVDLAGADFGSALAALGTLEGETAVVLAADAPDLPALSVGKLFSALTSVEVAVCPAEGGGLVGVGCQLTAQRWLLESALDLDAPDALEVVRAAAPPRALTVTPGWHRVRSAADLDRLDPDLEGWAVTRSWLATR